MICAGGTGGGVYPALSILEAAREQKLVDDVIWIGAQGGMEGDLVTREGIPFRSIPAAGVHRVGLRSLPKNLLLLGRGYFEARSAVRAYGPDVILFTGGYVAGPVAFAGRHVPMLLYVPDIEPGLALKFIARFADQICLVNSESRRFFRGRNNLVVTGHPTRRALQGWNSPRARELLGLDPQKPVLMVFGGSLGARSINMAVLSVLPDLLRRMQVVHITGERDWETVQEAVKSLPADLEGNYHAYPYLHAEMGAAYGAADLILSRAGASSVGEFPLFGIPAVLVPYPDAWRYQKVNADFLVRQRAAVMLADDQMGERLLDTILALLESPERREAMGQAMGRLSRPQAADQIAGLLHGLATGPTADRKGSRQ